MALAAFPKQFSLPKPVAMGDQGPLMWCGSRLAKLLGLCPRPQWGNLHRPYPLFVMDLKQIPPPPPPLSYRATHLGHRPLVRSTFVFRTPPFPDLATGLLPAGPSSQGAGSSSQGAGPSSQGAGPSSPSQEGAGPSSPSQEGAGPSSPSQEGAGPSNIGSELI